MPGNERKPDVSSVFDSVERYFGAGEMTQNALADGQARGKMAKPARESASSVKASQAPGFISLSSIGSTCQMSRAYSRMERSDENLPMRAVLRIDIRVQCS